MTKASRRDFLKLTTNALLTIAGLLGLGGLIRFFSHQPDPGPPTEFDLGNAADFPLGSRTIRADIPAVLYNIDGVLHAYSLTCTHLGCRLEEDGEGFACPCHGSRYSSLGDVLKSPATKKLKRYQIEEQPDGMLKLYTN